jgi:NAD-specific glutamate dehydrogenase
MTETAAGAWGAPSPDDRTDVRGEGISADVPVIVHLDPAEVGVDPRLRLYVGDRPATLSAIVPLLERLGLEVLDEHTETFTSRSGVPVWLHDVGVRHSQPSQLMAPSVRTEVERAFLALWRGELEADGFNRLIVAAGLTGAQVAVVRAYARYLLQISTPYSLGYLEDVLVKHADLARRLVELFAARFDPALEDDRAMHATALEAELRERLDSVASLDEDRIVRTFLTLVLATDRTNAAPAPARSRSSSIPRACPTCRCPGRRPRSGCRRRGSRACTCVVGASPAVGCAGATARRTSAPRCSA